MNDEVVKHLWALWRVNKALVQGLKAAVSALEKADELSPKKRQAIIDTLKKLIAHNENLSQNEPTRK